MSPDSIYNLVIVSILMGAQIMMRPSLFLKRAGLVFWLLAASTLVFPAYYMVQQYFLWLAHPVSRLLLPPHQGVEYFLSYSVINFYLSAGISMVLAITALLVVILLNKKFKGRFFEDGEQYLMTAGILLSGHPGWIYYGITILLIGVLFLAAHKVFAKRSDMKISFYRFWLPVAALAILISRITIPN